MPSFNKSVPKKEDTVDSKDRAEPTSTPVTKLAPKAVEAKCPDCNGEGIKQPTDTFVCRTCDGSGKAQILNNGVKSIMSDTEATAAAVEASNSDAAEATGSEGSEAGGDESEAVTQEEIASALKSSGINVKPEPAATDTEEEKDAENTEEEAEPGADESTGDEEETPAEESKDKETESEATDTEVKQFSLDVEDAEGVTHKIEKIEDLPEDFEPKNNRQIMQILKDLSTLESDKASYEADQAEEARKADSAQAVESIQEGWKQEFTDLNITDEARREEVMEYMAKENDKRIADGKPLIRSAEHALLGLQQVEAKAEAAEKAKADKETARKNGGLVGGSSAPASSKAPVYKSGSARNANEAMRSMGLLN